MQRSPQRSPRNQRRWWLGLMVAGMLMACGWAVSSQTTPVGTSSPSHPVILTVSAASDLDDALADLGQVWEQETGHRVRFNIGSTGQLAQQIERGAPVDVFAAANQSFIEDLDRLGLVHSDTKALYGVGRLTLWQRQDSAVVVHTLEDLRQPEITRIAMANPDHAPYGMAAREALQSAGLWEELQPKLILGENVKQTQQYAETGNVDVALVALSLSVNKPGQWTLLPETLHSPLVQMLAVPKSAPHPEVARHFASFMNGPKGRSIMGQYGFVLPGEAVIGP